MNEALKIEIVIVEQPAMEPVHGTPIHALGPNLIPSMFYNALV